LLQPLTIPDYVLLLRQHCKNGRPGRTPQEIDQYLDLVGYWQEQCRKAQEECDRLQSVNIRLERSNQMLSQRTSATPDDRPSTATMSPKRKANSSPLRATKRTKNLTVDKSVAQTQEDIEEDFDFLEELGDGETRLCTHAATTDTRTDGKDLIEGLHLTYQLCRATTRNAEVLCRQLVRTASAIGKVIRFVARNHARLSRQSRSVSEPRSLGDDKTDFAQTLIVCARAFIGILVGVTRMMERSDNDRLPSVVVAALAEMTNTILLAIESSARQTAEATLTAPPPSPSKKGKAKDTVPAVPKESIPARSLAHFLIGLLGLLEKTNPVHQKIFDGSVYLLLNRVASHLYYCTFGRHRSTTVEASLMPIPEPSTDAEKAVHETNALAIRLEVKALILILERAMGLAPHHMNPPTAKSKSSPANRLTRTISMKTLPSAPKGRLSALAKDKLQRTLVTCMYGGKGDDEFLDVLTKPVPAMRVGNLQNVAKVKDEDVREWYKEEVWRLVGWDVMARQSGL